MRVAFVSSLNGGVGTYTVAAVKELATLVEELDVYLFADYKRVNVPDFPGNVQIITVKRSGVALLLTLLLHLFQLRNYDIIHINHASLVLPVFIAKTLWGVPYIFTSHNFPVPALEKYPARLAYMFEARCVTFAGRHANAHVTISEYAKKMLQERYNTTPIIINYGMHAQPFAFNTRNRERIRTELGVGASDFLILFVGVLYKHKNAITLVNALPEVLKINPAAKLLIIGDGDEYAAIKARVKALHLEAAVFMPGFIAEIAPYYSAADLFVLPSTNEGFGFVFLEAMASGLPIATSNCSSCPEAVGDAGLLFDPGSSRDVADKIITLMTNDGLREQLRANGLRRVEQFTWARAAERYHELYRQAIGEEKHT